MRNAQAIPSNNWSSDWIPPPPPRRSVGRGRRLPLLLREASLAAALAVALSWGLGELVLLLLG
jgi:hypothetical protein